MLVGAWLRYARTRKAAEEARGAAEVKVAEEARRAAEVKAAEEARIAAAKLPLGRILPFRGYAAGPSCSCNRVDPASLVMLVQVFETREQAETWVAAR